MKPTFTLGIEEEYQTVDPETRDLRSHIHAEIIEKGKLILQERVKTEMHQSVVEVGTSVCANIKEAREELKKLRRHMIRLSRENGLRLASAATHPFADWRVQEVTPGERYKNIVQDMQLVARANLIFGLHVHVGIEDRETAIHMMNHARYFVPHLLALSSNSPFWLGMDTGLNSYRCKVFDKFPRTNLPDYFPSWGEYENYVKLLVKTNSIDNAKKIWWDIRPHPFFNTLEFRVCDIPMRVDETIALAALIQATVANCTSCTRRIRDSAVPEVAADGKQVAGGALRDQWKTDRLRQTDGSSGARTDRRVSGVRRRRAGRTGLPRGSGVHPRDYEDGHRRGPAVETCIARPAT
jgi:carboxylate-amine ligase